MKKFCIALVLIIFPFEVSSFGVKDKSASTNKQKEITKQPTDEELMKRKIEKADKIMRGMGMKGLKQTLEEAQDEEDRIKMGRGCLKFINVTSKKKGLLRNLGIHRQELYKARFRNICDFGIGFNFTINFIDKDGYVFERHNSDQKEIGKNMVDMATEEVTFFPSTDFKKIRQVEVKITSEILLRPRVPKEFAN